MAIHSSILIWKIPWTEEPAGLQSMGLQSVGHDWITKTLTHATGEDQRNSPIKNEEVEPKQKRCLIMVILGGESKYWCCKEKYCIETWKVRSMNQDKLDVVKQEIARVNTDILWISKLKWTGMGEFNSDDHYIYYCRQDSLRRME